MNYELNIKPKVHNITVLHHIVLALDAHLAGFANGSLRAILDIVVVLDDLGADEALLEIGVDDTGALRRLPAFMVSPCLYFFIRRFTPLSSSPSSSRNICLSS